MLTYEVLASAENAGGRKRENERRRNGEEGTRARSINRRERENLDGVVFYAMVDDNFSHLFSTVRQITSQRPPFV